MIVLSGIAKGSLRAQLRPVDERPAHIITGGNPMSPSSSEDITVLLAAWPNPDADAKLMPLIYEELRRVAGAYFRHERPNHTLQPTALLHEGYIRLTQSRRRSWKN